MTSTRAAVTRPFWISLETAAMARMWLFLVYVSSTVCNEPINHEILAVLGRNVVLPCTQLSNQANLSNYRIYWQTPLNNGKDVVVHFLNLGKTEELTEQNDAFRNRTRLFWSELDKGNFSLLLTDVRLEDEATYTCHIINIEEKINLQRSINLQVSAPYNDPVLSAAELPYTSTKVITCTATGGYPEPVVHWTIDGEPVPKDSKSIKTVTHLEPTKRTYSIHSNLTTQASEQAECTIENERLKENRSTSIKPGRISVDRVDINSGLALCDGYGAFMCLVALWFFWQI